ncbi:hypothetical protein [Actinotalea sp. JY-7876]|uniref:hypothetical protein n=1 Tax=Actinotalea sp. JY-7876 TaxID=2758442 RepID=UPI0015F66728|nr:hypothetical protein [Actinotalea sp. JY-7876]
MNASATSRQATAVKRIGAFVLACVSGAGIAASIHMMRIPVIEPAWERGFIVVDSAQAGGSLWLEISSTDAIDLKSSGSITVDITVSIDRDAAVTAVLGGRLAEALIACDGQGLFFDSDAALTGGDLAADGPRELIERYLQRRPATGHLFGFTGQDTLNEETAQATLNDTTLLLSEVRFGTTDERSWKASEDEELTLHPVRVARASCTFRADAFLDTYDYLHEFRSPDLVAAVADQGGEGPIHLATHYDLRNDEFQRPVNLFADVVDHVDTDRGMRVLTVEDDWWTRYGDGSQAILQSGGVMWLEPVGATERRTVARVAAGLFASILVATVIALVRSFALASRWLR